MVEFIREVTIKLEIDTNKRTVAHTCSSVSEAAELLRKMKRATSTDDMIGIMEEAANASG